MKNRKLTARILLIILVLAFATLACVGGGGGEGSGSGSSATTEAAGVTATYGAEQYHQQLTAVAQPNP